MNQPSPEEKALISAVFAKMDIVAMSVAGGVLCALILFIATSTLLLQSIPEGAPIGPHLNTLSDYLPGYSVSWPGSFIGLFYGFITGFLGGFIISIFWNLTHYIVLGALLLKSTDLVD